jgi:hypothetical protein
MHSVLRCRKFRPERADQDSSARFVAERIDVRTSFAKPEMLDMVRIAWPVFVPVNRWEWTRIAVKSKKFAA